MAERTPADIARDTLKLLASRRLPPTPENYQALYEEVAGLLPQIAFPTAPLRRIATVLPTQTPTQKRIAQHFAQAVEAQDWQALQSAIAEYAQLDLTSGQHPTALPPAPPAEPIAVLPPSLAEQLARVIESTASALGEEDERMQSLSLQLANFLRMSAPPLSSLEQMLNNYSYRLSFTMEDQAQRRHSIHALLHMVTQHIVSVAMHDPQLQQQAQPLGNALERPWTLTQLDTIQSCLKNLLFRHLEIEGSRSDAHAQLKDLLGQHAQQMASLGRLSEDHADSLADCAQQIEQSQDLGELAHVLHAVVDSGAALATENRIVQAQLADLRHQNELQEQSLEKLASQLAQLADVTRHDPSTGALNTQGLQEVLLSEAARSLRSTQVLSLAVLSLEQVPPLRDTAGPQAATAALGHAARLIRSTLRPQDALGRISDTRFAIVFPATLPAQAVQALARLQNTLGEQPLLLDEQKVALYFNAGVIAVHGTDTPAYAIQRAEQACDQSLLMGAARIAT